MTWRLTTSGMTLCQARQDSKSLSAQVALNSWPTSSPRRGSGPPIKDELQSLIDDFVLEEIYCRRAVALGIDRDDTIIRRRLRQKMEFLTDDTAALIKPTDEELAAYLAEHEDEFRESGAYTLQQVYFNPEKHGDDAEAYIAEQLTKLRSDEANTGSSGRIEVGDVSLLPPAFPRGSASRDRRCVRQRLLAGNGQTGNWPVAGTSPFGTWISPGPD